MVGNIPVVRLGQLSQLRHLPVCRSPAYWPWVGHGLESELWYCVCTVHQQPNHSYIINTSSHKYKEKHHVGCYEEFTSIPAIPSTIYTPYSIPFASCPGPTLSSTSKYPLTIPSFFFSFPKSLHTNTCTMYSIVKPSLQPADLYILINQYPLSLTRDQSQFATK